jgi:CubicO group peptidase (beta-lactamase class C family)
LFEDVEKFLIEEMEKRQVPGFSVAIVKDQKIIWSKGFGYANKQKKKLATPDTVYRVASVSKPVIATGLLQWVDKGKLTLDDPVNNLLKDIKIRTTFKEQPTVRNIISHTSGFPVHVDPVCFNLNETVSLEKLISDSAITVQPPNMEIVYSNTAFNIAGYLIGLFAKKPYPKYMEEELFKPLEMNSSSFEQTPRIVELMAQPYSRKNTGEPIEAVPQWFGASTPEKPCGSLLTTVIDLGHYLIAQMNGGVYNGKRILTEKTLKEMHKLQAAAGTSRSGYAISWKRSWHHGRLMLSHTGGNLGWTAHVAFYPELKTGIIILTNLNDNTQWRPPARQALHIAVGGTLSFDPMSFKPKRVPKRWERLVGEYTRQFQKAQIAIKEGNLVLEEESDTYYLEELDERLFLIHGGYNDGLELTFEMNNKGNIKQFDLETEIFPRKVEDTRKVEENADLRGRWSGTYVTSYGYFTMNLEIESPSKAQVTDFMNNVKTLSNFKAEKGLVFGNFAFQNLPEYVGWGAKEFKAELKLKALEGKLEGQLKLKSEIGETVTTIVLSKA